MSDQEQFEAEQELECLLHAFTNYASAKQAQQKAHDEFTGYSPGYFLSSYNDAVKDASAEFGNYLGKVIDRRVKAAIEKEKTSDNSDQMPHP
jgi:hypothetical protein